MELAPTFTGAPSVALVDGFDPGTRVTLGMVRTNPYPPSCTPGNLRCARWRDPEFLAYGQDGMVPWRAPRERGTIWVVAGGLRNGEQTVTLPHEVELTGRASDPDRDGLPDAFEVWANLDPNDPDVDDDGVSDGAEWPLGGLDPLNPDSDGDGLLDGEEVRLGLDPSTPDTDVDGLDDAAELQLGTDPLDPDTDGDDARDGIEVGRDLDPLNVDTDGDGIPDGADPWAAPGPIGAALGAAVAVSRLNGNLADPEFDPTSGLVAWQVADGQRLWVAQLDLNTGELIPRDGRGQIAQRDVSPISVGFNGPEWVWTPTGMQLLFSRPVASGDPVLWTAWQTPTGWESAPLPGTTYGGSPFGALEPDGASTVLYAWGLREQNLVGWRPLDRPGGFVLDGPQRSVRWAPDRRMVAVRDVDGLGQVFLIDLFGQEERVSDTAGLDHFEGMAIRMPELGNELVVLASRGPLYDSPSEVVVYRHQGGQWVEWNVIQGPPSHTHVVSPEVFTWDGRTYLSFLASKRPRNFDDGRAQVWVMSVDPSTPVARMVSVETGNTIKDPEPFTGGVRPWVYYTEVSDTTRVIWKAELGL